MKKLLFLLLISTKLSAQPFIGVGITSKGPEFNLGFMQSQIEVKFNYRQPWQKTAIPTITSLQVGKMIGNVFSVTPSVGIGYCRYKDFSGYVDPKWIINEVKEWKPIYSVEGAWDKGAGRIYIGANYAKELYLSAGIRFYFL